MMLRPSKRSKVSKKAEVRKFQRHVRRTKAANVQPVPMRGGIRL